MSQDALDQDKLEFDGRTLRYYSPDFMSGQIRIPKTYKITKKDLTLEDVSLIIRALEIGIADTHPLFEQAKQQGLVDVSI